MARQDRAGKDPDLLLGDDHVTDENRWAGDRIANAQHLGVLKEPVDLRQPDADEDGGGDESEHVRPAYRPQDAQLYRRSKQAAGNRDQQIRRPVADTKPSTTP